MRSIGAVMFTGIALGGLVFALLSLTPSGLVLLTAWQSNGHAPGRPAS